MATIDFPDPAVTGNLAIRISVSGGVGSATVGFYADGAPTLPFVSFDPADFTAPEQAANHAAILGLLTKAKAKQEAMAAAHTDENGNPDPNTINWVAP